MKMPYFILIILLGILISACASSSPSLQGDWKLISYRNSSSPTPAIAGVNTNFTFSEDGQLNGTVGCNTFGTPYQVNEKNISFQAIFATKKLCKDIAEQESAVFQIISNQTLILEITGSMATLTSADGASVIVLEKK